MRFSLIFLAGGRFAIPVSCVVLFLLLLYSFIKKLLDWRINHARDGAENITWQVISCFFLSLIHAVSQSIVGPKNIINRELAYILLYWKTNFDSIKYMAYWLVYNQLALFYHSPNLRLVGYFMLVKIGGAMGNSFRFSFQKHHGVKSRQKLHSRELGKGLQSLALYPGFPCSLACSVLWGDIVRLYSWQTAHWDGAWGFHNLSGLFSCRLHRTKCLESVAGNWQCVHETLLILLDLVYTVWNVYTCPLCMGTGLYVSNRFMSVTIPSVWMYWLL